MAEKTKKPRQSLQFVVRIFQVRLLMKLTYFQIFTKSFTNVGTTHLQHSGSNRVLCNNRVSVGTVFLNPQVEPVAFASFEGTGDDPRPTVFSLQARKTPRLPSQQRQNLHTKTIQNWRCAELLLSGYKKAGCGERNQTNQPRTLPRSSWRSSTPFPPHPRPSQPRTRCDSVQKGDETRRKSLQSIPPVRLSPSGHS